MPQAELSGPDLDGISVKRLAGRLQDRLDLENLERVNGKLPEDEIPGLDA